MQREDGKQIIVLNDRPQPLGAWLAVQRKRLNLTLGDLANAARIRRGYLEAIESGDYKALPGRAYAFAFVRTYAQYVGLDPEEATDRLRAEIAAVPSAREVTITSRPSIDAGVLRIAGVAGIVLVPLVGLGLWLMGGSGDVSSPAPSAPAPRVVAEAPPIPGRAPRVDPPPPAAFVPPPVPNAGPGAALATPFSAPPPGAPQVDPAPARPPAATQTPSPPQNQDALRPAAPRIAVRAQSVVFIEIRDASGNTVIARNLRQGERYFVPNQPGLVLTSARLNSLEIQVDNWILPPQGRGGRRELALEPDRLLQAHGVPLQQRGQLR